MKLSKRLSRNSAVDPFDVQQAKKALNRLGYYRPPEKLGITGIPDMALFDALTAFQRNHDLKPDGIIRPGGETEKILTREAAVTPEGFYRWRTVGDDRVRGSHAALDGDLRSWGDSPDPGEEINCRCWAEPVDIKDVPVINSSKERIRSVLNDTPAIFEIENTDYNNDTSPWYEYTGLARQAVKENEEIIQRQAKKHHVDPDLIRAVMWAENARGSWLGAGYLLDNVKKSKTIMPMNVYRDIWYRLISDNKDDLYDPEKNVEAGAILLKRIQARIIKPSPEKIGAIWEYIGQEKISDYAAYIGRIYRERPWIESATK